MTTFVGEIRMWGGAAPPEGWALCDGRTLPISENATLFQLIGRTYGGDGVTTFQLPDLRGRVPLHRSDALGLGEASGVESVTLRVEELPAHTHLAAGSVDPATRSTVDSSVPATMPESGAGSAYGSVPPFRPLHPSSVAPTGGGRPHENMQPFVCISFIISLLGLFPRSSDLGAES